MSTIQSWLFLTFLSILVISILQIFSKKPKNSIKDTMYYKKHYGDKNE